MNDAYRPSELRLFANAARLAKLGAFECDLATEQLTWTDEAYELFGLPVGTPLKRSTVLDLYTEASRAQLEALRADAVRQGTGFVLDAEIRRPQGDLRWMRLSVEVACEDGVPVRIYGAKQDITDQQAAWTRLREMAERDPLTGLANRRLFDTHYHAMVSDNVHHAQVAALVLIDLDRFKAINDTLGHAAGDECLRRAAQRLHYALGEAVVIARIGGDEFAVLLRAPLGRARIRHMLHRLLQILAKPMVWDGRRLEMGASIGAAMLENDGDAAALFHQADAALYEAKRAGGTQIRMAGDAPQDVELAAKKRA